jgi:serine/threonine-protein kinase
MERRIEDLTQTVAEPSKPVSGISSSSSADEGRFVAGTLLGGRYRIIGLLGRGGMGEVYRATDLTLGQSVALKFLPAEAAHNERLLERFAGEVRVARQVSHPNVCRVYDLGEVDGVPYISMEYVDGEDLSSLLTRIGRLPGDKALETARKICAGLAAAHDKGIIHRDLKPQNIMMNKRGEVVIMDFGLAAIADQLSGAEARNGTPAYMAPEQLKGAEVTARSDIYALGLVLYELFTGRRPYDAKTVPQLLAQQEAGQLTNMSSIATDIDPSVEKAIRRCLDPDPLRRPPTALAVSSALPGGDPLAAALAAGETPSPELVAAAGKQEGMPLKYSIPCFAVVVLAVLGAPIIKQNTSAMMHSSQYSPEVLEQKARDYAAAFGYAKKPADTAISINHRGGLVNMLRGKPEPRQWDMWLESEAPLMAGYRESPHPMVNWPYGFLGSDAPAERLPGMVSEEVDGHGHLRTFTAVPYDDAAAAAPVEMDVVFRAMGLDRAKFAETEPRLVPQHASDTVLAWKGPHPVIPNTPLWVEVALWKGRVTQAQVEFPFYNPTVTDNRPQGWIKLRGRLLLLAYAMAGFVGIRLARKNWLKERVDKRGALRLASFYFILSTITWFGRMHPTPTDDMFWELLNSIGDSLLWAGILWVLYLALEPAVRARWPHAIVTWNRILAGRWSDAQVGSHILIGAAIGAAATVAFELRNNWANPGLAANAELWPIMGLRQWTASFAAMFDTALLAGLAAFFAIFGMRVFLKKDWLAAIVVALMFTFSEPTVVNSPHLLATALVYTAIYVVLMFLLLRFGLVATISMIVFTNGIDRITLGTDLRAWWAPYGLLALAAVLAAAGYAFWRSIGTREIIE